MPSLALAPCLLIAGATAQVSSVIEQPAEAKEVNSAQASQPESLALQLRLVGAEGSIRVECDLPAQGSRMSLLISSRENLVAGLGLAAGLIEPEVTLAMPRVRTRTFAVDIPTTGLAPGILAYIQTASMDTTGRIRTSGVAPLELCARGHVCAAVVPGFYEGQAEFSVSPLIATNRLPPQQSSWEIEVQVTVRSNDWDLSHHVTRQGSRGTEIFVVLKEPGPGEGELDVVETHSVLAHLGSRNQGEITVYAAKTQIKQAPPSTLRFQRVAHQQ